MPNSVEKYSKDLKLQTAHKFRAVFRWRGKGKKFSKCVSLLDDDAALAFGNDVIRDMLESAETNYALFKSNAQDVGR